VHAADLCTCKCARTHHTHTHTHTCAHLLIDVSNEAEASMKVGVGISASGAAPIVGWKMPMDLALLEAWPALPVILHARSFSGVGARGRVCEHVFPRTHSMCVGTVAWGRQLFVFKS